MNPALRVGQCLDGRFRLVRRIGAGSTGTVWEADDAGQRVACKVLHPELSHVPTHVAQVEREFDVLMRLRHPNLTRPLFFGQDGDLRFLVLEFVDGQPLQELIASRIHRRSHFSVAELAAIVAPLCAGIEHAHAQGIIHRDLKPHNVMVDGRLPAGHVKVLDFGLARLIDSDHFDATTLGRPRGTVFYRSPEQARGEVADARSDVFALGCMLFELLTLRRAWVVDAGGQAAPAFVKPISTLANGDGDVAKRMAQGPRPSVRLWRAEIPMRLEASIHHAMAAQPEDRYASVTQFRQDVLSALADLGEGSVALPPPLSGLFAPSAGSGHGDVPTTTRVRTRNVSERPPSVEHREHREQAERPTEIGPLAYEVTATKSMPERMTTILRLAGVTERRWFAPVALALAVIVGVLIGLAQP